MSSLQATLETIRDKASNTTEQGKAFERLVKVFLENDPTQEQQYSTVWHYADWIKEHPKYPPQDTGIDLVAKLSDEEGFCAIQCKFRQPDTSITKAEIDSFISASSSSDFARRVLIDTTTRPAARNVEATIENLEKEFSRISLDELDKSPINWTAYIQDEKIRSARKKELRFDQQEALTKVKDGLAENDRGKMIMACGIGKTLTSLRIAEDIAGAGKLVLYMVPSLSLMSQAIREWKNEAIRDITAFSVCSDTKVGKRKPSGDKVEISPTDLALPATTDARKLSEKIARADKSKMTVIFATYHSIDVISRSQEAGNDLGDFDLIICDEAHRTTGATFEGEDESNFVKIHHNENVNGKKRLYMTATPRIYGETARKKAEEGAITLASMDNEEIFGKTLIHRSFGWAVEKKLLTDYKVLVLEVDEQIVSDRVQETLAQGSELKLDDAIKMVGCYKALAKVGITDQLGQQDRKPMKRSLAFCSSINLSKRFKSKFGEVIKNYTEKEKVPDKNQTSLEVQLEHVDGKDNAQKRTDKLNWLKDDTDGNVCRVLSNAKCLSEGVDVPALDAVMFLHPRKSQIDVVQAVGRVMRKAEGKELGYVILPIAVAPGVPPEKALDDNERYRVIWQILNALRSHDESLDGKINQIKLGEDVSDKIQIINATAVIEDVHKKSESKDSDRVAIGEGGDSDGASQQDSRPRQEGLFDDLSQAIRAKIVEKCGTREYWSKWATDIGEIAEKHVIRIKSIIKDNDTPAYKAFNDFLEAVQNDLNPSISRDDAVEMLAQHIITRPVFEILFQGNRFTSENAVSKAMENVLSKIYEHNIEAELQSLEKFYDTVRRRAKGISARNRQKLIKELYEKFFQKAFKKITQRLGIVYTPVEVVDFIIHSVEDVMKQEFGSSLGDSGVDILDPFAGTGTFISRLLQSGILSKEQIRRKFTREIHANEIVLLAYYIACINIEAVYDEIVEEDEYRSFDGMVLTDTFQLYEQDRDMVVDIFAGNSERRMRQRKRNIKVVIGNPPYSRMQKRAIDGATNTKYRNLDDSIRILYAKTSSANLKNLLYDSYVRAFRWASDRIGDEGVIGFVTNASWVDGNAFDGFRKSLKNEFNKIYVFHLRGNINKSIMGGKGEGENVFGGGSKSPVAITILVKNKKSKKKGDIFFRDINGGTSESLDEKQKLAIIENFKSIKNIQEKNKFRFIKPDEDNDWINQRDKSFKQHLPMGDKSGQEEKKIFEIYSLGIITGCDAWLFNSSKSQLQETVRELVDRYNEETERYQKSDRKIPIEKFVNTDPKKIGWHITLFSKSARGVKAVFQPGNFVDGLCKPFHKQIVYYDRHFTQRIGLMPSIFKNKDTKNLVIGVSGVGARGGFSCIVTDKLPSGSLIDPCQCFPLYLYDKEGNKRDAINTEILKEIRQSLEQEITNEMFFQYIYAVLHSQEYRDRFANNLVRELPRIPIVKSSQKFFDIVDAGEKLIDLHINYDKINEYPVHFKRGDLRLTNIEDLKSFYRVERMKHPGKDKSVLIYNENIIISGIPLKAYDYIISGKPALDSVINRQTVKKDKKNGIKNDVNDYANETMNNPAYPLELFQRVITVSLETMKIVEKLPSLDLD